MAHIDLELPYYRFQADGSAYETGLSITFKVDEYAGGFGGIFSSADEVADFIRDQIAARSGVASTSLSKTEETGSSL